LRRELYQRALEARGWRGEDCGWKTNRTVIQPVLYEGVIPGADVLGGELREVSDAS